MSDTKTEAESHASELQWMLDNYVMQQPTEPERVITETIIAALFFLLKKQ